jgi:hypothetical protein
MALRRSPRATSWATARAIQDAVRQFPIPPLMRVGLRSLHFENAMPNHVPQHQSRLEHKNIQHPVRYIKLSPRDLRISDAAMLARQVSRDVTAATTLISLEMSAGRSLI